MPISSTIEPDTPQPAISLPSASLWRRLIALVYDGFLLFALSVSYGALILATRVFILGQEPAIESPNEAFQATQLMGWWLVLSLFYVWSWRRSGQTLGMKTWRLRLQDDNGATPTRRQCWLRCLLAPISLFSIVGYAWALFSANGDCLHDNWTRTRVVLLPKADNKPS